MEEIILTTLELIFVYPGAYIRWQLFHRKTKTFKQVVADDWFTNSSIGVLVFGFTIGILYSILSWIN